MNLPLIPLRDYVLVPGLAGPLSLGRSQSLAAVNAALAGDQQVAIFTQKSPSPEITGTGPGELFEVGVRALIRSLPQNTQNNLQVQLEAVERIKHRGVEVREGTARVEWEPYPLPPDPSPEALAALHLAGERARELGSLSAGLDPKDLGQNGAVTGAYQLLANLRLPVQATQDLLEKASVRELLEGLNGHLDFLLQVRAAHQRLLAQAGQDVDRNRKDEVLRQELALIHKELGDDEQGDLAELQRKMQLASLSVEARAEAERQMHLLQRMGVLSAEYNVSRNYLELILDLPWALSTQDSLDLTAARAILEEDHFGLDTVKERILEYLAVMQLNRESHAPILCFVGPPGTGKTSLGRSIARALGRKFERLSLGGMHDESELRGHRRTYVGAMTGRIIQAIRRCKTNNPLVMLDEVDKLRHSYDGDPAATLLEILDPAQNNAFHDNYLDVPFDLSRVFFITTANTLDTIPPPLLDRMEVIPVSGYTPEEKLEIARRHLIPRLLKETGLPPIAIPVGTLRAILNDYTREAGVRQLERTLARLMRRLALQLAEGETLPNCVTPEQARQRLGPGERADNQTRDHLEVGTAVGLAYTESGGEVLYVEVVRLPRREPVVMTGHLGEVMRESAQAARSYLLSRYPLREAAVHIHVPAGSTPKDGPSAGLAIVCALASAFTEIPARADTAMTGEITLGGMVLAVGGLREKVLSAHRSGIRRVVLPRANSAAVSALPEFVKEDMELILVDRVEEVLPLVIPGFEHAFAGRPRSKPSKPSKPRKPGGGPHVGT